MIRSLFENMNNEQKKNVMFKPHPSNNSNLYINTLPEFEKIFGQEKLLFESVISTINKAKILICTTPETTFTECMLSNKPTILVYDSKIYKRHNICKKLINEMKKNKIIFLILRKRRNILIEFIKILINGITQLKNKKFKKEIFK